MGGWLSLGVATFASENLERANCRMAEVTPVWDDLCLESFPDEVARLATLGTGISILDWDGTFFVVESSSPGMSSLRAVGSRSSNLRIGGSQYHTNIMSMRCEV